MHVQEVLDLDMVSELVDSCDSVDFRKPHVRRKHVFRSAVEPEIFPMDISERLSPDCPSRLIRLALSKVDLSCLRNLYDDFGGIAYEPAAFVGIMLLAYTLGIRGSERIAEHCRTDLRFIYVGDGLMPCDRTIRRFRNRLSSGMEELFKVIVAACVKEGLVTKRLVAIDGTKMISATSQIERWFTEEEKAEIEKMGLAVPETSDPEARVMKHTHGYLVGYNCQAAVDCDSRVVVASGVTQCSADRPSLAPMVKKIVENLDGPPGQVVADTGYDSTEGVEECEKLKVDVIVAIQGQSPFFWTVTEKEEILCPLGKPATFVGQTVDKGKPIQLLRVHGCTECELYGSCCNTRCGRTLKIPVGCNPATRLLAAYRARGPEGKLAMIERKASIEPVFADIKWNKKFTRFLLRGTPGASTEWFLQHIARNIILLGNFLRGLFAILFAVMSLTGSKIRSEIPRLCRPIHSM